MELVDLNSIKKFLDIHIDHPSAPVFNDKLQMVVGIGILTFLLLWGAAKIIRAIRKP